MDALYILVIALGPTSIHATKQACDDAAYVLYEESETIAECHAIDTQLEVQCTTDASCETYHGFSM